MKPLFIVNPVSGSGKSLTFLKDIEDTLNKYNIEYDGIITGTTNKKEKCINGKFDIMIEDKKTNVDRIIGMRGIVTEDIIKDNFGEVKVDGKRWSAYSDTDILKGEVVRILSINSVKLKVEKWEE